MSTHPHPAAASPLVAPAGPAPGAAAAGAGSALAKLAGPLAPLLPHLDFSPDALKLLEGAATTGDALARLQAAGCLHEAATLAAHALPKREAVWWACMCAAAVPPVGALPPADAQARAAAEAWVRQSSADALRRQAWAAAQASGFNSPEAWAAVGAFWSGGSMAPEGQPTVPPAEHLTGVAVSGAVLMAAVRGKPERALERRQRFLAAARDIAAGGAGRMAAEVN
jgi:hypothetical protein